VSIAVVNSDSLHLDGGGNIAVRPSEGPVTTRRVCCH